MLNVEHKMNCAGVILMNNNLTRTVLVKTKYGNYSFPKGKKHKGETYFDAAIREFVEETGINVKNVTILSKELNDDLFNEKNVEMDNEKNIYIDGLSVRGNPNVRYYLAILNPYVDEETLNLYCEDPEELDNAEWIGVDDVLKLERFLNERKIVFQQAINIFKSKK